MVYQGAIRTVRWELWAEYLGLLGQLEIELLDILSTFVVLKRKEGVPRNVDSIDCQQTVLQGNDLIR